jgi:hypothetical protein
MLMQATGCSDRDEVLTCAQELAGGGHIGPGPVGRDDAPAARDEGSHMSFDLPADWRPQDPIPLSPATRKVMARAALAMVTVVESAPVKSTAAAQTDLTDKEIRMLSGDDQSLSHDRREIRRFAFRKFHDWRDVPVSVVEAAAAKDAEFLERVGGVAPHASSFKRALPRREKP